ncbi:MAG TPA: hypothetical protein VFT47_09130 [Vicinamibacterales bacterium]|nr:hypothetical protein [Vicinamibacterales bacterium]
MVDAKAMTLSELVETADRIFVGTVERVTAATAGLTQAGRSTNASIRIVEIRIDRALMGPLTVGQRLEVRQLASLSAPLNAGETVMWFLPADSALGLTQPLGIYSGDFRINMNDPARPAVNLRQNEGLWRDSPTRSPAPASVPLDLLVSATLSHVKR